MEIVVETYFSSGEASSAKVRVRALPGQGFDGVNVECSRAMRTAFEPGQRFVLPVKLISRGRGPKFLYSPPSAPWHPVTTDEAKQFIKKMFGK